MNMESRLLLSKARSRHFVQHIFVSIHRFQFVCINQMHVLHPCVETVEDVKKIIITGWKTEGFIPPLEQTPE